MLGTQVDRRPTFGRSGSDLTHFPCLLHDKCFLNELGRPLSTANGLEASQVLQERGGLLTTISGLRN